MKELPPVGSMAKVGCTHGWSNGDDSYFDNKFVYVIAHDKSGDRDVAVVRVDLPGHSRFNAFPAECFRDE